MPVLEHLRQSSGALIRTPCGPRLGRWRCSRHQSFTSSTVYFLPMQLGHSAGMTMTIVMKARNNDPTTSAVIPRPEGRASDNIHHSMTSLSLHLKYNVTLPFPRQVPQARKLVDPSLSGIPPRPLQMGQAARGANAAAAARRASISNPPTRNVIPRLEGRELSTNHHKSISSQEQFHGTALAPFISLARVEHEEAAEQAPPVPTIAARTITSEISFDLRRHLRVLFLGCIGPRPGCATVLPAALASHQGDEEARSQYQQDNPHQQEGYRAGAFLGHAHPLLFFLRQLLDVGRRRAGSCAFEFIGNPGGCLVDNCPPSALVIHVADTIDNSKPAI